MVLDNKVLEDIKRFAVERLTQEYGYCGVAVCSQSAYLNSGSGEEKLTITFETIKEGG